MRSYLKLYKSYIRKRVQKVKKEQIENVYDDQPRITAIVQVFNKRKVISKLIRRLQSLPIAELIVIDDGSIDGTWKEAFPLLNRKNDFLLRSNDLFEVRMYDRALTLARGKFAILLQDDDLPPKTIEWIENAIQLFENDEKLLILGGRDGLTILPPDPIKSDSLLKYTVEGKIAGTPGINKYEIIKTPKCRVNKIPFEYVMAINRAPMWVRREAFLSDGGIDQTYAPFQCDDVDVCLRAWLNGWHVGLYSAGFSKLDMRGMGLYNSDVIEQQVAQNWQKIYGRYLSDIIDDNLSSLVDQANWKVGFS